MKLVAEQKAVIAAEVELGPKDLIGRLKGISMKHQLRRYASRSLVVLTSVVVVGTSFSTPANAAPAIGGAIKVEYEAAARANGFANGLAAFGLATNNESDADNGGRFQNFAKGSSIYWKADVTAGVANQIGGLIRDKWGSLDWERSFLKYPTSRELPARKPGRFNRFQNGSIYWAQGAPSAYVIVGGGQIEQTWAANDWENGPYGFPTSDEYDFEGGKKQDFQNGSIVWKPEGFPEDWEGDSLDGGTDFAPECEAGTACGYDARGGPKIAPQQLPTPTPVPPRITSGRVASDPCLTEVAAPQPPATTTTIPATSTPTSPSATQSTAPTPPASGVPAGPQITASTEESTVCSHRSAKP